MRLRTCSTSASALDCSRLRSPSRASSAAISSRSSGRAAPACSARRARASSAGDAPAVPARRPDRPAPAAVAALRGCFHARHVSLPPVQMSPRRRAAQAQPAVSRPSATMTTGGDVGRPVPAEGSIVSPSRSPRREPAHHHRAGHAVMRGRQHARRACHRQAPSATARTPSRQAACCRPLGDEHQRAGPVRHHDRRRAAAVDLRCQRLIASRAPRTAAIALSRCSSALSGAASNSACTPSTMAVDSQHDSHGSGDPHRPGRRARRVQPGGLAPAR